MRIPTDTRAKQGYLLLLLLLQLLHSTLLTLISILQQVGKLSFNDDGNNNSNNMNLELRNVLVNDRM